MTFGLPVIPKTRLAISKKDAKQSAPLGMSLYIIMPLVIMRRSRATGKGCFNRLHVANSDVDI